MSLKALQTVGKTLNITSQIQTALNETESLYKLAKAIKTLDRFDTQSETEPQALRDRLLPLQRKLSDQLDVP